jgi:ketosteroid isomerase-like protein
MDREYGERFLRTTGDAVAAQASDHLAVLHAAYESVIQGNFDAFGASVTDDVELNISGFDPLNGSWRGRSEVVAATRKNFAEMENQQPEVEGMIHQGDCVAVLVRESGVLKSTGQAYRIRGVQWFTFADGKLKKIDEILVSA